ncbi:MAG: hypothetical protein EXR71_02890 [Myxococcales bacterium]|nr:hypothetical protein [Myxococcales bacterium]
MADNATLARLTRMVKFSLGVNVLLLAVNGGMFYFLLIFVVNEPATVEGVSAAATSAVATKSQTDPRAELRVFFKEKSQILDRAARRHGTNPADVVPTREEIEAAVESRTMRSAESELALQKLKEGFDYYNLTWPVALPNH